MLHVRSLLHFRGFTQQELAEVADISPNHFSAICRGHFELPLRAVEPLAAKLGLSRIQVIDAFESVRKAHLANHQQQPVGQ